MTIDPVWQASYDKGRADAEAGREPVIDISDHGPDTIEADGYSCGYMAPDAERRGLTQAPPIEKD